MLEPDTLARMLEQLRAEQDAAEAELATLHRRVNSLRQAVAGIEGLLEANKIVVVDASAEASAVEAATGQLEASGQGGASVAGHPRGAEAIRRVFAESEGAAWTVQEMTAELERRGWTPISKNPVDAVRTAMTRVWRAPNSGVIREGSKFLYRPSRNGDGRSEHTEVNGYQEMTTAAPDFTEDGQQPDMSGERS